MNYGYELRDIRKNKHMGINKLSELSGVSNAQISRIERNVYEPKPITLEKLAKGLNISKNRIFKIAGLESKIPSNLFKTAGYVKVPVYGSIPCGDPNTLDVDPDAYRLIPAEAYHAGCFLYRASGDSMEPKIKDGSLVMIDPEAAVDNEDIIAVSVNQDEATLKQIIKNGTKIVMLHPLNPRFDDIFPDSNNECQLIGKAISVVNQL